MRIPSVKRVRSSTAGVKRNFGEIKTSKEELLDRIDKMEIDQKQLLSELSTVKSTNDAYYAQELLSAREGLVIAQVFEDKSLKDMQNLATKLTEEHEGIVLFASISEAKVVLAQNGQPPEWSCGPFFKGNLGAYQGKGGAVTEWLRRALPAVKMP